MRSWLQICGFWKTPANDLEALMSRRLDDVRLAVLMVDGIDLKGRTNVVALGITTDVGEDPARTLGRLDRERPPAPRRS